MQDPYAAGYAIGYVIGVILAILVLLAIPVSFITCLIFAIRRKTKGWIIAACVTGALIAIFLLILLVAMVIGFVSAPHGAH